MIISLHLQKSNMPTPLKPFQDELTYLAAAAFLGAAFLGAAFLTVGLATLATRPDLVLVRTVSGFSAFGQSLAKEQRAER